MFPFTICVVLILSTLVCAYQPMKKEVIFKDDSNNTQLGALKSSPPITILYSVGTRMKSECLSCESQYLILENLIKGLRSYLRR